MKKILRIIPFILFLFCFTSCVDYVQSISYKDGKYHLYYKVTLSKMLFEMSNDEPEDLFEDFNDDVIEDLPESLDYNTVDTELEYGAEFSIDINPRTKNEEERDLLPKISGDTCFIPFLLGEDNAVSDSFDAGNSDGEAIAQAVLSSAKCRVLIGKNLIPLIEKAYFEGWRGINYTIPVYDYGESYCLEIPFIVIMDDRNYRTDKIVVIKG